LDPRKLSAFIFVASRICRDKKVRQEYLYDGVLDLSLRKDKCARLKSSELRLCYPFNSSVPVPSFPNKHKVFDLSVFTSEGSVNPFRKYRRSTDPIHVQKPGLDQLPFIRTKIFPTRGYEVWLDRGFTNCDNRASPIDSLPPMKTMRRLTRELGRQADSQSRRRQLTGNTTGAQKEA
jgi:hypothetical protein